MLNSMNYSSSCCQEQSFQNEPMFKNNPLEFVDMNNTGKEHPKTVMDFVSNLEYLLKNVGLKKQELAAKSGISARYIDFLLNFERYPTIEIAEKIGNAYGLSGLLMIMPNLDYQLAKAGKLEELLKEFSMSSKATQDFISDVLNREKKQSSL